MRPIARKSPLVVLMVLGLLSVPQRARADDADAARQQFRAGIAYLEDTEGARSEEAYAAFKKAYELSKSPKVLGNIGLCAMKLERDGEAIAAYQSSLKGVAAV